MRPGKLCMAILLALMAPGAVKSGTGSGAVSGKVTYVGTPAKAEPVDMSRIQRA